MIKKPVETTTHLLADSNRLGGKGACERIVAKLKKKEVCVVGVSLGSLSIETTGDRLTKETPESSRFALQRLARMMIRCRRVRTRIGEPDAPAAKNATLDRLEMGSGWRWARSTTSEMEEQGSNQAAAKEDHLGDSVEGDAPHGATSRSRMVNRFGWLHGSKFPSSWERTQDKRP